MQKDLLSKNSKELWKKTEQFFPNCVQTLSKAPDKFIKGVYPLYIESANGAYIWDNEGTKYIDYPLGLGAILLGHNYSAVNKTVKKQLSKGALFTLPSFLETQLAARINMLFPYMEQMQFLKTGSEAVSAAVKIARAYTGKNNIAYCGYHGWHDWYTVSTPKNKGIPQVYKEYTHKFNYNDLLSLEVIFENCKNDVAAVVIEPYIYDAPCDDFLHKLVGIAHSNNAVVIFDEVVTGFRTINHSAANYFKVIPDLSCFGKALGNGLPIAVVGGKKKIMEVLKSDCFVSSTFGGELLSIAAAMKVIDVLIKEKIIEHIWDIGRKLKEGYNRISSSMSIDTSCIGYPCRTMFLFPSGLHKSLFWQECIKRKVLFGYAQFISYSHTDREINYTLKVIYEALKTVKKFWDNPADGMEGEPAKEVFRLVVTK